MSLPRPRFSFVWLSIAIMVPLLMQLSYFGIPNRTFMLAYGIWVILVAWPLTRTHQVAAHSNGLIAS